MKVSRSVHQWLSAIGKRGGGSTSPAKAEAARINGRKGGRPPKFPVYLGSGKTSSYCREVADYVRSRLDPHERSESKAVLTSTRSRKGARPSKKKKC